MRQHKGRFCSKELFYYCVFQSLKWITYTGIGPQDLAKSFHLEKAFCLGGVWERALKLLLLGSHPHVF